MNLAAVRDALRSSPAIRLGNLPSTNGIYALRDHEGSIKYIGIAHSEGFRIRIRNKHATGSEDRSHKFSAAYNVGRLWRNRYDNSHRDGVLAKHVRNNFILNFCSASVYEIEKYGSKFELEQIERELIKLFHVDEVSWNRKMGLQNEPEQLVNSLILELGLSTDQCSSRPSGTAIQGTA